MAMYRGRSTWSLDAMTDSSARPMRPLRLALAYLLFALVVVATIAAAFFIAELVPEWMIRGRQHSRLLFWAIFFVILMPLFAVWLKVISLFLSPDEKARLLSEALGRRGR